MVPLLQQGLSTKSAAVTANLHPVSLSLSHYFCYRHVTYVMRTAMPPRLNDICRRCFESRKESGNEKQYS